MKKTIINTLIIIAVVSLLSGCTATNDPLAFCNKLNKTQIEQLLNSSYRVESVSNLDEKAQGCKVISDTVEGRTFNVIANKSDYPQTTQTAYQKAINVWKNSTIPNRENKDITGIGDKAFWSYNDKVPQLIAYKETKIVIITLGNFNLEQEEQLNIATEIATSLLSQQW